jgi:FlaA1/EpsC-like NDP-sugar epimerase
MASANSHLPNPRETASQSLRQFSSFVAGLPAWFYSRQIQMAIDIVLGALSVLVAYRLRFDAGIPMRYRISMWMLILTLPLLRMVSVRLARGYEIVWRYFSFRDATLLAAVALPPSILLILLRLAPISDEFRVPLGVIGAEYFSFVFLAGAARGMRRLTYEGSRQANTAESAIIVGPEASLAGAMYQASQHPDIRVVGLLTPDADMEGKTIQGVKVLGSPSELGTVIVQESVSLVLVSDASMANLSEVVSAATEFGAEIRLLPSASNVMRGDVRVAARPNPEAILSTGNREFDQQPEVVEAFRNRTVLITGAGGSIGSELCRQVARFPVRRILLLDQDENSIFEIHGNLRTLAPDLELVQIVGDIRNGTHMRRIFGTYLPDIVLHAAAYKHVPVMEVNRCQAVLNNVGGTRELADLSIEFEVGRFLMISTDKAVHPTSIMGATKRIAEIIIQNRAASPNCPTRFGCVRFGNVVGSRGSVIPIFLRQINEGGPITITHELMTRYFMTIPEAVQLVLQAATLAESGQLYMLDMGDPKRIVDIARKLIESAGLRPDQDIQIKITGIRQGEKLHEQLWLEGTNVRPTRFQRVYNVPVPSQLPDISSEVETLEIVAQGGSENDVLETMKRLPIEFREQERAFAATMQEGS